MIVAVLFTTSTPPSTRGKTLRRSKGCPFFKVGEGKRNGHVKSLCPRKGHGKTKHSKNLRRSCRKGRLDDISISWPVFKFFLRLEHLRWFKVTIPLILSYLFIYYPWTTFPKVSPSPPSTSTREVLQVSCVLMKWTWKTRHVNSPCANIRSVTIAWRCISRCLWPKTTHPWRKGVWRCEGVEIMGVVFK